MRTNLIGLTVCLCALSLGAGPRVLAQAAELPQPSPHARVEQHVGLTDFSVDYSSPAVHGRKIWGELVAYDKPWRTGANAATTLTASGPFTFGGKKVPAGSYALYTVPGKTSWTVALNSDLKAWGDSAYDSKKDIVRVSVKPETPAPDAHDRERLTFTFDDTTDSDTQLVLAWEKLRVRVPVHVDTQAQAMKNIEQSVNDAWRPHFVAARYLLTTDGELETALRYADQSISIKPTWSNQWVRAQILQKKGLKQEAAASADKSLQLGKGDRIFEGYYKAEVSKAATEWKK